MATTEHPIFKVKEGYILLEDLESWYAKGLVTPQDRVQIFDGHSKNINWKIETLIHRYGPKFPFRRIPKDVREEELSAETSQRSIVEVNMELEAEPSEPEENGSGLFTPKSLSESSQKSDVEAKEVEAEGVTKLSEKILTSLVISHPEESSENPSESPLKIDVEAKETEVQKMLETPEETENAVDFPQLSENLEDSTMKFDGAPEPFHPEATNEQQWSLDDQENFQPGYSEQSVCYQQEYIPLLSVPLEPSVMISPKELSKVVRSMSIWLQNSGKQQAAEMPVNWTCEFCGIQLISELEAFNHIISEEHLTMMSYIAPVSDLEYWKNWVLEMNSKIPLKRELKSFEQMDVSGIQEFVPQSQAVHRKDVIEHKDDFTYFDNLIKRLEFPTVPVATVLPRMATVILEPEPIKNATELATEVLTDVHCETTVTLPESEDNLVPESTKKSKVTEEEEVDKDAHPVTTVVPLVHTVAQEPTVTSTTVDEELNAETTVTPVVKPADPMDGIATEGAKTPVQKKLKKKGTDKKCCIQ